METGSCSQRSNLKNSRILCDCGLPAKLRTAWTDKNPGRRFFGCSRFKVGGREHCKYFDWFDKEEISGWPKIALIEARDEIRRLNRENGELRRELEELRSGSLAAVAANLRLK